MTCHEFSAITREYVRQQQLAPATAVEADSHLALCQRCRRQAEAEQQLESFLAALRAADATLAPCSELEARLAAAFAAQQRVLASRRRRSRLQAALGVAAALLVLIWGAASRPRLPGRPEPSAASFGLAPEFLTEFVPIRYGKPLEPGEPWQMIRIALPQAELARVGIPVPPDTAAAWVQADVLIGEDGLAKAIRFVW